MKKFLIAAAGVVAFAAPAVAADIPVALPVKAPVVVPVAYNWSGCYIGGQVGGAWGRADYVNTANTTAFGDLEPGEGFSHRGNGIIGGGHIGCNIQTGQWVFGLEGALSATSIRASLRNTVFPSAQDDVFEWRNRWIGSVVGKVGWAFVPNWLLYVKGGFAFARYELSVSDTVGLAGSGSDRQTHTGWTVGAGLDYGITPNWIVGVDYNFYRFESKSYQLGGTAAPAVYTFDMRPRDVHAVMARISYKFGPSAIIARY